jgi:hypothetical protein
MRTHARGLIVASSSALAAALAAVHGGDNTSHSHAHLVPRSALHVWGTPARIAALWGEHLTNGCPRSIAWRAGAGAAVKPDGEVVGINAADGAVASLKGYGALDVAIDGDSAVFFNTKAGRLMRWVPFGATKSSSTPTVVQLPPERSVVQFACGSSHCLAIDDLGVAYSWATRKGGGKFGVLGRPVSPEDVPTPVPISGIASQCACGDAHSVIVGVDGEVWSFGSNRWMQLGQSSWDKGKSHQTEPQRVTILEKLGVKAEAAACGADHTLVSTRDGRIFGWGKGKEGQLGLEGNPFASEPRVISGTTRLPSATPLALAAGSHCSVVALRDTRNRVSLWWLGLCTKTRAADSVGANATRNGWGVRRGGDEGAVRAGGERDAEGRDYALMVCGDEGGRNAGNTSYTDLLAGETEELPPRGRGSGGGGSSVGEEHGQVRLTVGSVTGGRTLPVVWAVLSRDVDVGLAGCASCKAKALLLQSTRQALADGKG